MTRKRFIKLMMAKGLQKNKAREIALLVHTCGSYDKLYKTTAVLFTVTHQFIPAMVKAISSVGEAACRAAEAMSKCLTMSIPWVREQMKEYDERITRGENCGESLSFTDLEEFINANYES